MMISSLTELTAAEKLNLLSEVPGLIRGTARELNLRDHGQVSRTFHGVWQRRRIEAALVARINEHYAAKNNPNNPNNTREDNNPCQVKRSRRKSAAKAA